MKVVCDPEVDVLRILLSSAPVEESDEEKPGLILDYDKDGNIVGLEILDASTRIENPRWIAQRSDSASDMKEMTMTVFVRQGRYAERASRLSGHTRVRP